MIIHDTSSACATRDSRRRARGMAVILALIAVAIAVVVGLAVSSARDSAVVVSDQSVRLSQSRLAAKTSVDLATFVASNYTSALDAGGVEPARVVYADKQIGGFVYSASIQDAVTGRGPTRSTVAITIAASAQETWPSSAPAEPSADPPPSSLPTTPAGDVLVQTINALVRVPWPDTVARADIDLSEFALLASTSSRVIARGVSPPSIDIGAGAEVSVWRSAPLAALGEPIVIGSALRDPSHVSVSPSARLTGVQRLEAGSFPQSSQDAREQLADGVRTLPEDIHVPRLQAVTGPGEDSASNSPVACPYSELNNSGSINMSLQLPPGGRFSSLPLTFSRALQPGQWRVVRLCGLEVVVEGCQWKFEVPTMLVVEGKLKLLNGTRFEVGERGALTIVALDGVMVSGSYIGPALGTDGTWSTTGAQPYAGVGASRVMILEGGNPSTFRLTYLNTGLNYEPTGARKDSSGGTNPTISKDGTRILDGGAVIGEIYAPDSSVEIGSGCALYGRALAHWISVLPGGRVFYDPQLDTGAGWLNPQSAIWGGSGSVRPEVLAITLLNDELLARFSTSTGVAIGPVGNEMLMTADAGDAGFLKRDMNRVELQFGCGNGSSPFGPGPAQGAPTPVGVPAADYVFPATLQLWGTIRDFRERRDVLGHADFGLSGNAPTQAWVVGSRLDGDGKPVVARPPAAGLPSQRAISSETSFATWFRDTPGQNLSRPRVLSIFRVPSYGHTPQNPRWVYGVGGGSLGMSSTRGYMDTYDFLSGWNYGVNLSWTVEFVCNFVYRRDKQQWLHVAANNDVWVYLDGSLLIDVGGRSQPTFRAVDLNSVAASFGLVDNQTSQLKIFVANRRAAVRPSFQIWMNFPFNESLRPEIVRFSRLEEIKRVRNDVASLFHNNGFSPLDGVSASQCPRILGFTSDVSPAPPAAP
jgi:fibro-slime domain-containing protein